MSSAAHDTYEAELRQEYDRLAAQLLGLQYFARLPQAHETMRIVQEQIALFDRRLTRLEATLQAMDALAADGYPEMPTLVVDPGVYQDLQADIDATIAALTHFSPIPPATQLAPAFSAPQAKE